MNEPDRFELFIVPDDVKKLSYEKDTKIPNAGTFRIEREDHTMGNLLRMQLHEDDQVLFSGYKQPHPLEHHILVKVQTTESSKPEDALQTAVSELLNEFIILHERFDQALRRFKGDQVDGGAYV